MRMVSETTIREDPDLAPEEKELTIRGAKDQERLRVHSDLSTVTKYLLRHPSADILDKRTKDGDVVSVEAEIPVGLLGLSNKPRASDYYSGVVSNSELEARDDG